MKLRLPVLACLLVLLAACGQNEPQATGGSEKSEAVPQAQLPRVAAPTHYAIRLTIDPTRDRFGGHAEIAVRFAQARRSLFIHGRDLHVTNAVARTADGKAVGVKYEQVNKDGVVRLTFGSEMAKGDATLIFDYDAPYDTSLAGLYKVVERGDSYAFTQFENTDARRAFPGFDEPGFKATFDIAVVAPSADKVVGNTPIRSTTSAGNGMTQTTFARTRPLPTYLIALAVGPLDIVDGGVVPANQYRNYPIPVRGVTARGNGARIKYALSLTPSVITALENYYGIAYPFQKLDVLAVPDFAAGAMENAGAITYRERLLLDSEQSLEQRRDSLAVQAHELAHQWFGDYVTPVWWDDIWLNESFANWMESKIADTVHPTEEHGRDRLDSTLDVMDLDEAASARQIHQPVHNMDDIDNAFDRITYDKGSAVLAMFESYVGEDAWRAGVHAYLTKFAFRNATAQDFIGTIAEVTHHPEIVSAFNSFIDQAGIPAITVDYACEANDELATVKTALYAQIGRGGEARYWHVPMCFAEGAGGKTCALADRRMSQIDLKSTCNATPMPNANGKGYYRFFVDESRWQALLKDAPQAGAANQLTLFANIDAAFHAGNASAATYFAAVTTLAPIAQWDLLKRMQVSLHRFRTGLLEPDDLVAYRALMAKLFVPRLGAIGLSAKAGEPAAITLAREYLAMLVVEEARDQATMTAMAKAVAPYVASGGKASGALAPDILPSAMRAGIILEGAPFAQKVTEAAKTSDGENFRRSAIYGLAGAQDRAALAGLFAWMADMRGGEVRYLFQFMKDEPLARDALWSFLREHLALVVRRVSNQGLGRAPSLLEDSCSGAEREELKAFFGPRTGELEGTARPLAQTDEKIGYCLSLKTAKGAEYQSALHAVAK